MYVKKNVLKKNFTHEHPNTCIKECGSTYTHISENNECLNGCTLNILPQATGKPRYVSDCATYSKYTLEGNKNCHNSCLIGGTQYKFDDGFKCVSTCPGAKNLIYIIISVQ